MLFSLMTMALFISQLLTAAYERTSTKGFQSPLPELDSHFKSRPITGYLFHIISNAGWGIADRNARILN